MELLHWKIFLIHICLRIFVFRSGFGIGEKLEQMQMISHAYLVNNLPRFLLLNSILLLYVEGDQSIEEKCAFFQDSLQQLQPLKALLNDPKLILSVYCCIDRGDPSQFREHSELLEAWPHSWQSSSNVQPKAQLHVWDQFRWELRPLSNLFHPPNGAH